MCFCWLEMMRFPSTSLEARLLVLRNEIQKVFLCAHQNNCAHTGKKKKRHVRCNFHEFCVVHWSRVVWHCTCRNSFAEDESIKKPQGSLDGIEIKKGKGCGSTYFHVKISIPWPKKKKIKKFSLISNWKWKLNWKMLFSLKFGMVFPLKDNRVGGSVGKWVFSNYWWVCKWEWSF